MWVVVRVVKKEEERYGVMREREMNVRKIREGRDEEKNSKGDERLEERRER